MFTYNYYQSLLFLAQEQKRNLVLRHDVDYSLKKAVEFAEYEANLGVKSTYYILLNGQFYNPYYPESLEKIKMIKDLGHELGLHIDLSTMKNTDTETQSLNIQAYRALLEYGTLHEIRNITFHKPFMGTPPTYELVTALANIDLHFPDMDQRFKYISDSGFNWRENPIDVIMNYQNIQMNCHPVWWGNEECSDFETRVHELGLDLETDRNISNDIKSIREYRERLLSQK